jgi:hypothetical protein
MKNFLFKFFFSLFLLFLCFKLNNINVEIVKEIIRFDIVLTTVSALFLSFSIFFLFIRYSILNNFLANKNFDKKSFIIYLRSLVLSNLGFAGAGEIYRIFYRKKANLSLHDVTNIIFFERSSAFLSIIFLLFIFSQFNFIYLFLFIFIFYFFFINKTFFYFIISSPYINFFNNRLSTFLLIRNIIVKKLFIKIFIISIIIQLLSMQDGTVLDALLMWKKNVEKELDGIEPCPICYSILHPKSMSLPKLKCPTCNNKFHNQCLFTWFKSSGKSKCVVCQQPMYN